MTKQTPKNDTTTDFDMILSDLLPMILAFPPNTHFEKSFWSL